jgi:hypothetical protein
VLGLADCSPAALERPGLVAVLLLRSVFPGVVQDADAQALRVCQLVALPLDGSSACDLASCEVVHTFGHMVWVWVKDVGGRPVCVQHRHVHRKSVCESAAVQGPGTLHVMLRGSMQGQIGRPGGHYLGSR